jgi:hypothetical protein
VKEEEEGDFPFVIFQFSFSIEKPAQFAQMANEKWKIVWPCR